MLSPNSLLCALGWKMTTTDQNAGMQAAWAAIQVYLELHQKPAAATHGDDDLANSGLSPEDLKKATLKRKKVPPLGTL